MGKRAKFKIVVGDEHRHSEIWTISINKSDVYLSTTGAKHTKISLHESGQAAWSIVSEALEKVPYIPPAGRHLARWQANEISMGHMQAVFYLLFPESELQIQRHQDLGRAIRIPAPEPMNAAKVHFAMTPPVEEIPPITADPHLKLLFTHQLADKRILVVSTHYEQLHASFFERANAARVAAWNQAVAKGLNPVGTKAGGKIVDRHGVEGFFEVAPNTRNPSLPQ